MRVLLICSAGMSTSLLVRRMKEDAKSRKIEAFVWSCGSSEYRAEIEKSDVILIGPQMRFLHTKIQEEAKPRPVRVIDMMTYGRMDGSSAIEMAIQALKEKEHE